MASVGFHRSGDRYVHAQVLFYVEFPRGPLAIGDDYQIVPVTRSTAAGRALVLSATDSCDRVAAFYHWNDRQSLDVAVSIARRNRIDLARVRRWSAREGFTDRFVEFVNVSPDAISSGTELVLDRTPVWADPRAHPVARV
jgi:hypothetical protein